MRSSRILIAAVLAVGCSLCPGRESHAESIRIRAADDQTSALVRTMLEKISTNEPELAARGDVATWGPGFKRFAEGECDILVSGVFPDAADMKHLSWTLPVGSQLQEFIAGQQRVLVIVNKANPVNSVSLEQLAKMLAPSDKPAAWAAAGGTVTMASQPAATMTHFSTAANELKFIPPFETWPTAPSSPGFKAAERLYSLVDSADNLSSEVFHDEDSRCRSLAAVTFGLAESAKYVTRVAKLLDDDAVGIPLGDACLITGSPTPGTVGDVARRVLATRLGLRGLGDVVYGDPILTESKAFLRYWRVAETPTALPSEWVFRMKTRRRRGRDIDDVKRALCENKSVEKWLVVPIVATFVEDAFTDDEVLRVLRNCPDRSMLKRLPPRYFVWVA